MTKKNNTTVSSKSRRRSLIGMRRHAQTLKDMLQFRKMELSILLTPAPATRFTRNNKNSIKLKPNTRIRTRSCANENNLNEKHTKSGNRGNKRPSKQENVRNKFKRIVLFEDYDGNTMTCPTETNSHDSSSSEEEDIKLRPTLSTSKIKTNKSNKSGDRILELGEQFKISKASLNFLKGNFIFREFRIQLERLPDSSLNTSRKDAKPTKTDAESVEKDAEPTEKGIQPNEEVVKHKGNGLDTSRFNMRECFVVLDKLPDVVPAVGNLNISNEKIDDNVQDSDSSSDINESNLCNDASPEDVTSGSLALDLSKIKLLTPKIVIKKVSVPSNSGISVPIVSTSLNSVAEVSQDEKNGPSLQNNSSASITTCASPTTTSSDSTISPNVEKSQADSAGDSQKSIILKISRSPSSQKYTSSIAESNKITAPKRTPNCDIRSDLSPSRPQLNKSISSPIHPLIPPEKTAMPENQQSSNIPSLPEYKKTTYTRSTQTSPSYFNNSISSTSETSQLKSIEDPTCSVIKVVEPSHTKSKHDRDQQKKKRKDRDDEKEKNKSHRSRSSDHSSNRERSSHSSGRSTKEKSHREQDKERSTSSRHHPSERLSNEKKDSHHSDSHRSLNKEKSGSSHHSSENCLTQGKVSNRHHSSDRSSKSHRRHSSDRSSASSHQRQSSDRASTSRHHHSSDRSSSHHGSHSRSKSVPKSMNEKFSSVSELLRVLMGDEDDKSSESDPNSYKKTSPTTACKVPGFFSTSKTYSAVLSTVKDASSNGSQGLQNSTATSLTSSSSTNVLASTVPSTYTSSTNSKATNVSVASSTNSTSVKSSSSFTSKHVSSFYPEIPTISAGKNSRNPRYVAVSPKPHNVPFSRSSVTNAIPSTTSGPKMPHTPAVHSLPVTPLLNVPTAKPPQMSAFHPGPINRSYVPNFNTSYFKPVYVSVKLPQTTGSQPIIQRMPNGPVIHCSQNPPYQPRSQHQIKPTMPPKPHTFVKPAPLPIVRTPTKSAPLWKPPNPTNSAIFNQYLPSGPSISPSYSKFMSINSNYAPSTKYKPAQPSAPLTGRSYVSDSSYKQPNPSTQMTSSNQVSSFYAPPSSSYTYTSNTVSCNPSFSPLSPVYVDN